jgi:hypothetical protein
VPTPPKVITKGYWFWRRAVRFEWIVPKEAYYLLSAPEEREVSPILPSPHRRLNNSKLLRDLLLTQTQVQTPFPQMLAEGMWSRRISGHLAKIRRNLWDFGVKQPFVKRQRM